MNSKRKGKRGELAWCEQLKAHGYPARRGQQFSGSPDSPDVVCSGLPQFHFEVKNTQRLKLDAAIEQARADCGDKLPLVAHKANRRGWLVSMEAEVFFRLIPKAVQESLSAVR